jgi:hypothetical protein
MWAPVFVQQGVAPEEALPAEPNDASGISQRDPIEVFMELEGFPYGRPYHVAAYVVPLCTGGQKSTKNVRWYTNEEYLRKKEEEAQVCQEKERNEAIDQLRRSYTLDRPPSDRI